jgi:hypothetical protein
MASLLAVVAMNRLCSKGACWPRIDAPSSND